MKNLPPIYINDIQNSLTTNKYKNQLIVDWIIETLTIESISTFSMLIENSINSLPSGVNYFEKICPKTGKIRSHAINYRDIAKRSFVTAWKNARDHDLLSDYKELELKFKLSSPVFISSNNEIERGFNEMKATFDSKPSFNHARSLWLHCERYNLPIPDDVYSVFFKEIEAQELKKSTT